ncbi:DUF6092 family protein [Nonomuraea sp. NPDC002799]
MTVVPDVPYQSPGVELARLAARLLSGGRALADEPRDYAVARLMSAAHELLRLADAHGLVNPHFAGVRVRLDEFFEVMSGDADVPGLLDELCLSLARGLKEATEPTGR